ncbi:probable transcription factor PosF21 [Cucurbita maxima]|uniref:Probable transcription factor PosF21 n=1 Tax=Cucurbita maxima TaxID=3661 RepID=A0A6J1IRU3_CUCMA|nr:probable transcription factor PosF21 [Cucurbita maxima]XP_022979808.1 probable transcription factor PosF21 [Cucurbita maxima]
MDNEKPQCRGGGFLQESTRYSGFSSAESSFNGKSEAASSSMSLPPLAPSGNSDWGQSGRGMSTDSNRFSHDISRMPENPRRNVGHRRAHSEILTLPDDICFDSDLGIIGGGDGPSLSDDTEEDLLSMYLDMDKFNSSPGTSATQVGDSSSSVVEAAATSTDDIAVGLKERPRVRHQHSQSMDGVTNIKPEMLVTGSEEASAADSKKAVSAAKLAELALIDPKRAKRIWANRQSAARSKERKMRYIAELERKVQTLQTEATSLSTQLTLLQRDANGITAENSELKLRLQTMEQQVHLQDALNEALKEEIQHLKVLTGQAMPNGRSITNFASFGGGQQFYPSNNQAVHTLLTAQQFQQLQIQSQQQQQQHFQYQQLHQLQQQQAGDIRMKRSISPQSSKDAASDTKPPPTSC